MGDSNTPSEGQPAAARRVTIADLAARLGLTKGTVSRALNGYPDIAESTRRRVERAAQELGYHPMSQAQAIRTGRVRAIGLVLQTYEHDGQRPFLADFLAGLAQVASDERWTLTIANATSAEELPQVLGRLIAERKADGFVLPRTLRDDPRVRFLRAQGTPFVLFGRTADPEGCAWFDIESEVAMAEAVARLHGLGHRRIGFVHGDVAANYDTMRLAGYRAGLATCGLPYDEALIIAGVNGTPDGTKATRALIALQEPPTAILFATDRAALGAWPAAEALGLTIGRDLSVIGYDGLPEGSHVRPGLTSYAVDNRAAGEELATLLIRRCRGEAPETLRQTARATLLPRGSDGPPALSPAALARLVNPSKLPLNDIQGG